ncbi:TIGR00255 family protein [Fulvimarina manganoxydans]|uniref:TIGR00255 family protein n=1 Tax=Fulvimarina manganoxydans TaxID=937218 RepID=A0A1W1ZRU8_9HYPH|nr:YicC/YloC family endoribonuclease [Fulvimarina manganoxydans]MCK5930740.1 YicC family protein [Fulvimarina manganoxydans]SMC50932.1 TIGR00255 family protein [Fulvimarina manganoxydans]
MALRSMTGFARQEAVAQSVSLVWELKSVNGRGLDLRLRMPPGFEGLENGLRAKASARLSRGNVHGVLSVGAGTGASQRVVDEERLAQILAITDRLVAEGRARLPTADGLLQLKGVLDFGDRDDSVRPNEAVLAAADDAFAAALEGLVASRESEGRALETHLSGRLERIEALIEAARQDDARRPEVIRARIAEQVARLHGESFDEARLHQEAAIIAVRADIGEEIDRLASHASAIRDLLATDEAVGRRLDFLTQEMNRESNTICSKSNAVSLSAIGLELKVVVDQFREQVQNVE